MPKSKIHARPKHSQDKEDEDFDDNVLESHETDQSITVLSQRPVIKDKNTYSKYRDDILIGLSPLYPNSLCVSAGDVIAASTERITSILEICNNSHRETIEAKKSTPHHLGKCIGEIFPHEMPQDKMATASNLIRAQWSPLGCALNGRCLLATITDESKVLIYAPAGKDEEAPWTEVVSISDLYYRHCQSNEFVSDESNLSSPPSKRVKKTVSKPSGKDENPISLKEYIKRVRLLSFLTLSWSPIIVLPNGKRCTLLLLVGKLKSSLWKLDLDRLDKSSYDFEYLNSFNLESDLITEIAWSPHISDHSQTTLAIATANGSVGLWGCTFDISINNFLFKKLQTVCKADGQQCFSICWNDNKKERLLAIGKGNHLLVFDEQENQLYVKSNAHSNIITGICWMRGSSSLLFTCSLDGNVQSWKLEDNIITLHRTVTTSKEGIYGLAISTNSLFLFSLERLPPVIDVMYERKKATAKLNFIPIDGYETSLEYEISQKDRSYLYYWDILRVLSTSSSEERFQNAIMSLEGQYFGATAQKGRNINDKDLEIKFKNSNLLRLATALRTHQQERLVKQGLTDDQQSMNQEKIESNSLELVQLYLHHFLTLYLSSSKAKTHLTKRETTSLLLMADWITLRNSLIYTPLLSVASKVYSEFTDCKNEVKQLREIIKEVREM